MTSYRFGMALNGFATRLPAPLSLLVLVSCSSPTPECSAGQVTAKVKEMVLHELGERNRAVPIFDPKSSKVDLRAIRTMTSDERRCACRAELVVLQELNADLKAGLARRGAEEPQVLDFRYNVERTDDGKDLYITIGRF